MRRKLHVGHNPRHLQLQATRCSWRHWLHLSLTKPCSNRPQCRYESGQHGITFAKVREECVGVLLDDCIQQRSLGAMTRITAVRRFECGEARRVRARAGGKHPTDWNASMPPTQCALGSLRRCLYPLACQSLPWPMESGVHHGRHPQQQRSTSSQTLIQDQDQFLGCLGKRVFRSARSCPSPFPDRLYFPNGKASNCWL